jgi:hypothetical protein
MFILRWYLIGYQNVNLVETTATPSSTERRPAGWRNHKFPSATHLVQGSVSHCVVF